MKKFTVYTASGRIVEHDSAADAVADLGLYVTPAKRQEMLADLNAGAPIVNAQYGFKSSQIMQAN